MIQLPAALITGKNALLTGHQNMIQQPAAPITGLFCPVIVAFLASFRTLETAPITGQNRDLTGQIRPVIGAIWPVIGTLETAPVTGKNAPITGLKF